jgi:hypothetical protein
MSYSKLQKLYAKKLHVEAKPSIDTHQTNLKLHICNIFIFPSFKIKVINTHKT